MFNLFRKSKNRAIDYLGKSLVEMSKSGSLQYGETVRQIEKTRTQLLILTDGYNERLLDALVEKQQELSKVEAEYKSCIARIDDAQAELETLREQIEQMKQTNIPKIQTENENGTETEKAE